ncbi:hypothetical protein Tco_1517566 [Tanacetum coccineum]
MPDNEIMSVSGFKKASNNDYANEEELSKADKNPSNTLIDELVDIAKTQDNLNTFAATSTESDPLVSDKIDDSIPRMVAHVLKERLDELLPDTLKTSLPDLLNNSVKKALHKFVLLQKKLGKAIRTTVGKYVQHNVKKQIGTVHEIPKDILVISTKQLQANIDKNVADILELVNLIRELVSMIDPVPASPKAATEGGNVSTQPQFYQVKNNKSTTNAQGEQASTKGEQSCDQAPLTSTALIIYSSSEEPLAKKLKFALNDFLIPFLNLLNSIRPPADDKGNGIASEDDQLKQLMPFMEQSGPVPKISNLYQFSTAGEGPLSIEEDKAEMEEIKRLADLKAEKEKSEKRLKKVMTPDELRAHAEQLATYEAKKDKDARRIQSLNHFQG